MVVVSHFVASDHIATAVDVSVCTRHITDGMVNTVLIIDDREVGLYLRGGVPIGVESWLEGGLEL